MSNLFDMKFSVHINKYEHILALCYHNNKIINVNFITFNVLVNREKQQQQSQENKMIYERSETTIYTRK